MLELVAKFRLTLESILTTLLVFLASGGEMVLDSDMLGVGFDLEFIVAMSEEFLISDWVL